MARKRKSDQVLITEIDIRDENAKFFSEIVLKN